MNSILINEAKFERIRWLQDKQGIFRGEWSISRQTVGRFDVIFELCSTNGETRVEVRNDVYKQLDWERTYPTYKAAVEGVKERFEEIDELIKRLKEREKEIKAKSVALFSEAIDMLINFTEEKI